MSSFNCNKIVTNKTRKWDFNTNMHIFSASVAIHYVAYELTSEKLGTSHKSIIQMMHYVEVING